MNLQQLIREIHWLEWQLRTFEDKYGVLSQDFYRAMESGQLDEFDDADDPRFHDFIQWHGLMKTWMGRKQAYDKQLVERPVPEQLRQAPMLA